MQKSFKKTRKPLHKSSATRWRKRDESAHAQSASGGRTPQAFQLLKVKKQLNFRLSKVKNRPNICFSKVKCVNLPQVLKRTRLWADCLRQQVIDTIVTSEIPSVANIEYNSVYKAKQLLAILAETSPYTLNISALCTTLQSSRNNVLKLIDLMDKAAFIRRLYAASEGMNMLTKPEKILFNNTNLMYALSPQVEAGTKCETYLASQLSVRHRLHMPVQGDLVVDGKWLFEVGGKSKGFSQIKNIEDSFVVSDNIDIGHGDKIPLWLFGLLY